ncbi:hypothetical protein ABE10_12360 [Bacillus toyonensis]|nr:hypothetical protein [Bacillus toyonensis]
MRSRSGAPCGVLARHPERLLKEVGGGGVHGLVAADVVLAGDGGVAVAEELRGELESSDVVDGGGGGAAEPVRGDVFNAGLVHDVTELAADVVRRVRCSDAGGEQQCLRADEPHAAEPSTDRTQRESRERDATDRACRLRMILPVRGLTLAADDRPRDTNHRYGCVEVSDADREDFADAGGRTEHDFHDLTELSVGAGASEDGPVLPVADRGTDGCDLVPGEHVGTARGSA